MSLDVFSPPDAFPLPQRRRAALRASLLEQIEGRASLPRRLPRRRVVLAVALLLLLFGAVGTAVGFELDFLAEQERVDQKLWTPPEHARVGSRVEIARGPDWSFMASRSAGGFCLAYAAGTTTQWARSCGREPDRAGDDRYGSDYLIATLITTMGARDGLTAMGGIVTREVARVELLLADGQLVSAATEKAPPALDTDARLFFARVPFEFSPQLGEARSFPIRAYVSFRADGELLERYVVPHS